MAVPLFVWFYIFVLFQPRLRLGFYQTRLRTRSNIVSQWYLHKSRSSPQLQQFATFSLLQQVLFPFSRSPHRFWVAPRQLGFWEDVCLLWQQMGCMHPDLETTSTFKVSGCPKTRFGFFPRHTRDISRRKTLTCDGQSLLPRD